MMARCGKTVAVKKCIKRRLRGSVMATNWRSTNRIVGTLAIFTTACSLALAAESPDAMPELITPGEVLPAPSAEARTEVMLSSAPVCSPARVSSYRWHRSAKRFSACHRGTIDTSLVVDNPADCASCCYEVAICVPACCAGEPRHWSRVGLFGRGIVEYRWRCGWTVRVIFRARGDVVVHYEAT